MARAATVLIFSAGISSAALAATTTVQISDAQALKQALATATGGETFVLAPGNYGNLSISGRNFASAVTIKSADPNNQARFSDTKISKSSGIVFKQLAFFNPLGTNEIKNTYAVQVQKSEKIMFDGITLSGSRNGDPSDDGHGLQVRFSSDIKIVNGNFSELARAMVISESKSVVVANNRLSTLRSDGIDFAGVQDVEVTGNRFSDFQPAPGDHSDAIQFWTRNSTLPTRDIRISDNLIVASGETQGIFMRANYAGFGTPLTGVEISGNILSGTAFNGIALFKGTDVDVLDNMIFSLRNIAVKQSWIRLEDIKDLDLVDNTAAIFLLNRIGQPFDQSGNKQLFLSELERLAAIARWDREHSILDGDGGAGEPVDPSPPTAVPEPAAWLFMILGFGALGAALRRARFSRRRALEV